MALALVPIACGAAATASAADVNEHPAARDSSARCEARLEAIAPGVMAVRRALASPARDNAGCVANGLVVFGAAGTLLVDPGPHRTAGDALAVTLARRGTPPVRWIVFTQARPERVLAAIAWTGTPGVRLLASSATARHMREQCGPCVARFAGRVGKQALRDTSVPTGVEAVVDGTTIDLGGRRVLLRPLPSDAPDDGLVVRVPSARLAFVGGLAGTGVLAEMRGSPQARIDALERLVRARPARVLGSDGAVGGRAILEDALHYARALKDAAEADVRAGGDAATAGTRLVLPGFADRALHAERHPLNVDALVRRLETTQDEHQPRDASLR